MVDMEVNIGDVVMLVYMSRFRFTRRVYGLVQKISGQPLMYTVEGTNVKVDDIIFIHKYEGRSEHSD